MEQIYKKGDIVLIFPASVRKLVSGVKITPFVCRDRRAKIFTLSTLGSLFRDIFAKQKRTPLSVRFYLAGRV